MANEMRQYDLSNEQAKFLQKIYTWLLKNKNLLANIPYFDKGDTTVEDAAIEVSVILARENYYSNQRVFLSDLRHFYIMQSDNTLFDYETESP